MSQSGLKPVIAVEQRKSVFDDNSRIIFCQFSTKNMLQVRKLSFSCHQIPTLSVLLSPKRDALVTGLQGMTIVYIQNYFINVWIFRVRLMSCRT